MVPRGGIEPFRIALKRHHFFNGDLPVYLPVDPVVSSRREGATLCRHTRSRACPCYRRRVPGALDWYAPQNSAG